MNKIILLLFLITNTVANAADFTINFAGSSEKKLVYYDSTNLKIGTAVMPGGGAIDTVVGVIGLNALVFPNNSGRTYVSAAGANFSYDSYLDSNCKVPLINVVWGVPTKNSLMNVYNGYVKFLGLGPTVTLSNEAVYKAIGGNSGVCAQNGTFTGTVYAASQYQTVVIPFTVVPPVITQFE